MIIEVGDVITKVTVTKTDNCGRDTGREGYDIHYYFASGKVIREYDEWVHELDDRPNGIYLFENGNYVQLENWE